MEQQMGTQPSKDRKDKHTPGPWTIEVRHVPKGKRFAGERFFELMAGDRPLGRLDGDNAVWLEDGADEANARLIAAAPELLEALKALMYLTDQGREGGLILSRADGKPLTNGDQDVIDQAYIAADKAKAKAEGGAL